MIQIRSNTFETNSSSSHSLVLSSGMEAKLTPEKCRMSLWFDYDEETGIWEPDKEYEYFTFNRYPFKILRHFDEKLMFLYANAPTRKRGKDKYGYDIYEREYYKISREVRKILPEYRKVKFIRDRKPSCEAYGVLDIIKEHISLIDFLTDPNVIVICDGDEYNNWYTLKKLNILANYRFKEVRFPG